jgi:hypothetical protein
MDASQNEQRLVVLVTSDVNPGTYYLYDKGTHQLSGAARMPVAGGDEAFAHAAHHHHHDDAQDPGLPELAGGQ